MCREKPQIQAKEADRAGAADAARARLAELDGRTYEVLTPAAERLGGKYPAVASLLYRRMAESILARGSSRQYCYAARDVRHSASLADQLADDGEVESHESSVAPLQRDHSWKYSFWRALEAD